MAVPVWASGQVLLASDVNTWFVPQTIVKPSNTSRASNTTVSADPDLVIAGAANSVYGVTGLIIYNGASGNVGLFQFQFTVPASASFDGTAIYEWASGGADVGATTSKMTAAVTNSRIAWTGGTGTDFAVAISGVFITAGTAGNLTFLWSQNVSNGTATTVKANSYLTLNRIG